MGIVATQVTLNRKIKILFVSHSSAIAGAEKCLLTLMKYIDRNIIDPVVILPMNGPLNEEIKKLSIKTYIHQPFEWWVNTEDGEYYRGNDITLSLEMLKEIVEDEKPDIIQSNTSVIWEGAVIANRLNIPHVWHVHEILDSHPTLLPVMSLPLMYSIMNTYSDSVVAVSNAVKNSLGKYIEPGKLSVIYNGIDSTSVTAIESDIRKELGIDPDAFISLTVASFAKYKGLEDLVDAAAVVCNKMRNIHFVIAGTGTTEARDSLNSKISSLALKDRVHLLGFRSDVPQIMNAADFIVVPSINESFSLVTAEALAAGKLVVSTDCGGPAELIEDGKTGFIVPVHDPFTLATTIIELCTDKDKICEMGELAKIKSNKEFTAQVYSDKFCRLYVNIITNMSPMQSGKDDPFVGALNLYMLYSDKEKCLNELKCNIAEIKQTLIDREQQVQLAKMRSSQLEGQLHMMYKSLSWRITAPLRRIGLQLPRILQWVSQLFGGSVTLPVSTHHDVIRRESFEVISEAQSASGSIGVHLHLYYIDLLDEISTYLSNIPYPFHLYVSITDGTQSERIKSKLLSLDNAETCTVKVVPNRGRDVAPFVVYFADDLLKHDFICHIHSKKSLYTGNEQAPWRKHFFDNLLGNQSSIRKIFGLFHAYKNLGILYPETYELLPYWAHTWLGNKASGHQLSSKVNIVCDMSAYIDSPMGTMFWARTEALRPILSSGITINDFPEESGQKDGTLAHGMERILVPVALRQGYTFCEINMIRKDFSVAFGSRNLFQYWAKNLDDLKNRIMQHELITFDIFDTLITRPLLDPDSAFDLLTIEVERSNGIRNFREIRKTAEAEIRGEKGFGSDVGIDEIYYRIGSRLKLESSSIVKLCSMEKEIELHLNRPRPEVVEAFRFARDNGKRVVMMSDMYLDERTVRSLLARNGIEGYSELFLSSSMGVRKDNATMWLKLLESCPSASILHIGDNEHSDVQIPSDMGISVYHVMSPKNIFNNSFIGRDLPIHTLSQNVANSAILGLSVNYLYSNPFVMHDCREDYSFSDKYGFGYAVLGPIIFAYLLWLLKTSIKDNVTKILFLAREGYLLKQLFDMILAHQEAGGQITSKIESVYLLASRRAVTVPAISDIQDALNLLKRHYSGKLNNLLETRFGLNQKSIANMCIKNAYVELPADLEKVSLLIRENFDVIKSNALRERECCLKYLNNVGLTGAKGGIAVSDLGYSGNIQKALSKLMNATLKGYYFATCFDVEDNDTEGNKFHGYFTENDDQMITESAVYKYSLILESILTAPDGQLVCFDDSTGEPLPVFGAPNDQFNALTKIHEGITSYCSDMLKYFGRYILNFEPDKLVVEYLFRKVILDNKVDPKILSELIVEDRYCNDGDIEAL